MEEKIKKKIEIIEKYNTDDSRFVERVLEAFLNKEKNLKEKKNNAKIISNINNIKDNYAIIDLDTIWAKKYFYTKMRVRLEKLVNIILNTSNEEIENNPSKIFKKAIYNGAVKKFEKTENQIDIVDYIKSINNKKISNNYIYLARKIDEETLFKYEQITKAIEIMKIDDKYEQMSAAYDEIYNYLNSDFVSNKYCDFINNKCIAQRKHKLYPISNTDGCCFMYIKKCNHLENGNCKVQCLPCRLFSCNIMCKRGIMYYGTEIILMQVFFNKKQRKQLVFDFWKDKEYILRNLKKEEKNN